MLSADRVISVMTDGQDYRLQGVQAPAFSQGEFQSAVLKRLDDIELQIYEVKRDQEHLRTSVYCVLGAIGVFIAAMGVFPAFRSGGGKESDARYRLSDVIELLKFTRDAK